MATTHKMPGTEGCESVAGLTSLELVHRMGAGWNLGNTLDAHYNDSDPSVHGDWKNWYLNPSPENQETMWGNPLTTREMIAKIKESGFDTIRVPVTWYMFTGPAPDYAIDKRWLARVQEIVSYVLDNGMFCILNTHHEDLRLKQPGNGWLKLADFSDEDAAAMKVRMGKLWEQIAEQFKDYNEYLLFEALNEPGMHDGGRWTQGKADLINDLLQIFVGKVRASGGKNTVRHLMIPPYGAAVELHDDSQTERELNAFLDGNKLRINDPGNRLIVSLHYYEPFGFCSTGTGGYDREFYDRDDSHIKNNVVRVLSVIDSFTGRGIPVIMGETGVSMRRAGAERIKWAEHYLVELKKRGVPAIIWDDGGYFRLFERNNLVWFDRDFAGALVAASKTPVQKTGEPAKA